MKPDDGYLSDQWVDYRRRVRWNAGLIFAGVLLVPLCAFALEYRASPMAIGVLAAAWLPAFIVSTLRLQFFPCPNCGKPFAFRVVNNLPYFVKACVHCGLPKWEH